MYGYRGVTYSLCGIHTWRFFLVVIRDQVIASLRRELDGRETEVASAKTSAEAEASRATQLQNEIDCLR